MLRFLGKFEDATVCFRRAIEPDSASSHFDLGIVLMESEKSYEAVVSFRRALEIDPGYAEALTNLGIAMKKLGQLNDAVASYRQR
ncbi:MAG: tetratricopeptide repeat protein [Nitrosomonadales bacterium]